VEGFRAVLGYQDGVYRISARVVFRFDDVQPAAVRKQFSPAFGNVMHEFFLTLIMKLATFLDAESLPVGVSVCEA
jgi:hypothetical protein